MRNYSQPSIRVNKYTGNKVKFPKIDTEKWIEPKQD